MKVGISKWTELPIGASNNLHKIDLPVDGKFFHYHQKALDDNCIIINVANICAQLGDEKGCKMLQKYFSKDGLFEMQKLGYCTENPSHSSMMKSMRFLLRKLTYQVFNIESKNVFELNQEIPFCVRLHSYHTITVWKNEIYDANHTHTLKLSQEWLDWCCGNVPGGFDGIKEAFYFYPCKKLCGKLKIEVKKF